MLVISKVLPFFSLKEVRCVLSIDVPGEYFLGFNLLGVRKIK
uniref:Uncharacterized protein n=1 Tax=Arundo donax TaxID=35708 RepID=A0A0A9BYP6_ARUDO